MTTNQVDPLIEWVQMDNPLYPTCITGYVIRDELNQAHSTTVDSLTRSLTTQQLNSAGFPYCTTIHPLVTPITSVGPLMTAQQLESIILQDPSKHTSLFFHLLLLCTDIGFPRGLTLNHNFALENGNVTLQVNILVNIKCSYINQSL